MNNEIPKLPDELFRQGLENFEAPYSEAAWGDMRNLLDKADRKRPFVLWFQKNKKTTFTLITITMITTTIISALALIFSVNDENGQQNSRGTDAVAPQYSEKTNPIESKIDKENLGFTDDKTKPFEYYKAATDYREQHLNEGVANKHSSIKDFIADGKNQSNIATKIEENASAVTPADETVEEPAIETEAMHVAETVDIANGETTKTPSPEVKNEKSEDPVLPKPLPYRTFRGPWMGIHFTAQQAESPELMDSARDGKSYGFNWQFMSNNLMKRNDFGAYGGFDFGAQWYGKTKNYGVVLDNTQLDSGFTRLTSYSLDFFARGHFEYARFPLKPYVNAFFGPRIYGTSQYTEAYRHKTEYENSSSNNAYATASLMYGGALGARLAISKHVSIDARYEIMQGTETNLVNLNESSFSGLSTFTLSKFKVAPAYHQVKVGVLFDLWDSEETNTYHEENSNEVVQVTEYYYYDSTTMQYIKVNCRCNETPVGNDTLDNSKNTNTWEVPDHTGTTKPGFSSGGNTEPVSKGRTRNSGSSWGSGSSGSSGKGSFPGIKSGGGGVKIKN